ncbi:Nup85 Nucleoporin [Batrachochytrium dendrobatidis JEL423]|uniref:Nuclear pore complex protein Nup85 n=1 Tax=Batrachochytrium dendrobatidis (strain JEL423) TaxID=403673 RepID=A0A177WE07_BATDL|nr:Nup85 Nucleoporin [Batrachochytrium dendrobatidis JEL423]
MDSQGLPLLSLGLCPAGAVASALLPANRCIRAVFKPLGSELLAFAAARLIPETLSLDKQSIARFPQDQLITKACWLSIPESRLSFYQVTLGIFVSTLASTIDSSDHSANIHSRTGRLNRLSQSTTKTHMISKASTEYRIAIYNHVRSLENHAQQLACRSDNDSKDTLDEIQQETSIFSAIHSVWHLAHILFFDDQQLTLQQSSKSVLADLINWLSLNHSSDIQSQFEDMISMVTPADHPQFWPYIFKCLLRGHFVAASTMLGMLFEYKTAQPLPAHATVSDAMAAFNPVTALTILTQCMPTPSSTSGSQLLFQQKWSEWKDCVAFIYSDGKLASSLSIRDTDTDHFITVFGILAGDEEVLFNVSHTWQEALVALGMFVYPLFQPSNVKIMVDSVTDRFSVDKSLDQVQLALFETDISKALRYAAELDWWLVTHLIDLFDKAGLLQEFTMAGLHKGGMGSGVTSHDDNEAGCTLSEWYRLAYADYLLSSPALWRVSIEYYVHCPRYGFEMLAQLIPRLPLDSDLKTRKLLAFCNTHGLQDTKRQLHSILARKALSGKRIGEAISHYIEAGQDRTATAICNRLLVQFFDQPGNSNSFCSVMDTLNPALFHRNERLAFLSKYREFHHLYTEKEFHSAGKLLVMLLTSNSAPKSVWRHLLLDALPLLEGEAVVFSTQDTFELMRCLEEVVVRDRRDPLQTVSQVNVSF